MKKNILVIIFYLFITIILFSRPLLSNGTIVGGDWGLPLTNNQMRVYSAQGVSLWRYSESFFGAPGMNYNDYIFRLIVGLISFTKISGRLLINFFLIFLPTFAGFALYKYCRYLKLSLFVSTFSGLFYIMTPVFFNYTLMGWVFVLLSLGLLPITIIVFTKSIKDNRISYAVIAGLLYSFAFTQSQSLIWYPMVLIPITFAVVTSKKEIINALKSAATMFSVLILTQMSWILPFIFKHVDSVISKSDRKSVV